MQLAKGGSCFRSIINIVYLSVLLRFPLKEQKGAWKKKSRARAPARDVTIFCVSLDTQISQGNGALISHCHENSPRTDRSRERESERENENQTCRWKTAKELEKKKKERKGKRREWEGEEWKGTRNRSTIAFHRTFPACVRACVPRGKAGAAGLQFRGRASSAAEKAPMYKHDRTLILVFIHA